MSESPLSLRDLENWILDVSGPEWIWFVKYLAANDTYAKQNVHQGGPHIGKAVLAAAFPALSDRADRDENPDLMLPATLDSHSESMDLRLVWYNSKRLTGRPNGRDEARFTRWGGSQSSLVEPEATGSLVVFAFRLRDGQDADALRVWRCRSVAEEDYLLERVEGVEPGRPQLVSPTGRFQDQPPEGRCALEDDEIPESWRGTFPSGEAIVEWVVKRLGRGRQSVDDRLMSRRDCEFALFRSVERFHAMPRISEGFASVDAFVEFAGSLTNRRKARAGRSLEIQTRRIFDEEKLAYSWTPQTEERKTPDFIFPSIDCYHDDNWPADRLRMLAAKTTCKDRWRQILAEADRVPGKHLLTLQEGVSLSQHREMRDAGVQLVVPAGLAKAYPDDVRVELLTLEQFISDTRAACGTGKEFRPTP